MTARRGWLLHHGLERWGAEAPDRLAVQAEDGSSLTYGELDAASGRLSQLLVECGVRPGDRVGIYLDKSLDAVLGVYGALKAGAAYVPLDPHQPASRVAFIAANCGIAVIVTDSEAAAGVVPLIDAGASLTDAVVLDDGAESVRDPLDVSGVRLWTRTDLDRMPPETAVETTVDRDIGYLLYTSGSTGRPKGVTLSHQNGMAFAEWAAAEFDLAPDDRVAQTAPLIFDLSTFDLFASSIAGASVHLVSRQTTMFPGQFKKLLRERAVTVVYAVPSILTLLVERAKLADGELPDLRTVLFAGEVFPTKHLARLMGLLPGVEFANLYGPTETNVCTFHRVDEPPAEDDPPVPIGRAVDNDQTFVVRDDGTLADPGELGELWVRGATVMQGYWADPERTAESLLSNPLSAMLDDAVYRTGDLVVEESDGSLRFFGRRDNQVKRMGYRVELGEIEAAINTHPAVTECAVVAVPDEVKGCSLTAHLTTSEPVEELAVLAYSRERIPRYMVPDDVRFHEQMPLTPTGKTDRVALTEATTTSMEDAR